MKNISILTTKINEVQWWQNIRVILEDLRIYDATKDFELHINVYKAKEGRNHQILVVRTTDPQAQAILDIADDLIKQDIQKYLQEAELELREFAQEIEALKRI